MVGGETSRGRDDRNSTLCLPSDACRHLDFTVAFDGNRLVNHIIRTIESVQVDFCGSLCFMEHNCVSYNMEIIGGSSTATKCELNNATHNEHHGDLKQWSNYSNYFYRGIKVSEALMDSSLPRLFPIFLLTLFRPG